jgi:indolepyruvate ferredoxin oxidoreductase beta subunit
MTGSPITNILMIGVGGQGIILASDVLSQVAMDAGLDVKKSEVHGMSQRGGSVSSHVRFGAKVWSPIIPEGQVDILMAFELAEGLRDVHHVHAKGRVIASTQEIVPPIAAGKDFEYPPRAREQIRERFPDALLVDARGECLALGNEKMVSVLFLGILSACLDFSEEIWTAATLRRVPKGTEETNMKAFRRGRELTVASSSRATTI